MKRLFFASLLGLYYTAMAQNVGIGTNNPISSLHIAGANPALRIDQEGSILLYSIGGTHFSQLRHVQNLTLLQNTDPLGSLLVRMGSSGTRDVVINGTGLMIGTRGPIGSFVPAVPLEIASSGEVMRVNGTTPFLTMLDGGTQRGYIQAWTDGIAIASNGFDVGLWTNGAKRLAIKPNGALEIAGSTGAANQVLTSNGPGGNPAWRSPLQALYNSFRFVTPTNLIFTNNSDGTWRDVPGLTATFTLDANHYVDVAAQLTSYTLDCVGIGCGEPRIVYRLLWNGNVFTGAAGRGLGVNVFNTLTMATGFTLPAGTHTLKIQVLSNNGGNIAISGSSIDLGNNTFMRYWTVPQ